MKVQNTTMAGQMVTMPNGDVEQFNEHGVAVVNDACGIDQVPGYEVVEGVPIALVLPGVAIQPKPGPDVLCTGPESVANIQVSCPDGFTIAKFDGESKATVPDTCGLDSVPGYSFGPAKSKPKEKDDEPVKDAPKTEPPKTEPPKTEQKTPPKLTPAEEARLAATAAAEASGRKK